MCALVQAPQTAGVVGERGGGAERHRAARELRGRGRGAPLQALLLAAGPRQGLARQNAQAQVTQQLLLSVTR